MANYRITKGQKLSAAVSARAWNHAQDAADIVFAERATFAADAATATIRGRNVVRVVNQTDRQVPLGGVLRLIGPMFFSPDGSLESDPPSPADRAFREMMQNPTFAGGPPLTVTDPIGVALEPVGPGATGRFAVGGVFPMVVRRLSLGHRFATGRVNDVRQLVSAECGPVRILFANADIALGSGDTAETVWALGAM